MWWWIIRIGIGLVAGYGLGQAMGSRASDNGHDDKYEDAGSLEAWESSQKELREAAAKRDREEKAKRAAEKKRNRREKEAQKEARKRAACEKRAVALERGIAREPQLLNPVFLAAYAKKHAGELLHKKHAIVTAHDTLLNDVEYLRHTRPETWRTLLEWGSFQIRAYRTAVQLSVGFDPDEKPFESGEERHLRVKKEAFQQLRGELEWRQKVKETLRELGITDPREERRYSRTFAKMVENQFVTEWETESPQQRKQKKETPEEFRARREALIERAFKDTLQQLHGEFKRRNRIKKALAELGITGHEVDEYLHRFENAMENQFLREDEHEEEENDGIELID